MAYSLSKNIDVFPSTNRDDLFMDKSRLLSEVNLIKLVNQLLDVDSFVITHRYADLFKTEVISDVESVVLTNEGKPTQLEPFRFNIKGYYISLDNIADIIDNFSIADDVSHNIYARITLEDKGLFTQIKGSDTTRASEPTEADYEYVGVEFVLDPGYENCSGYDGDMYYLRILERPAAYGKNKYTYWIIPYDSKIRVQTYRLMGNVDNLIGGIDDGTYPPSATVEINPELTPDFPDVIEGAGTCTGSHDLTDADVNELVDIFSDNNR